MTRKKYNNMEKTYKRVPFDIELAKKIQAGEVEGRIVTDDNLSVRLLCTDANLWGGNSVVVLAKGNSGKDMIFDFDSTGKRNSFLVPTFLIIKLPEETSKHEFKPFDRVLVRNKGKENSWHPRHYAETDGLLYYTTDAKNWQECIPYAGNEHLLGTTKNS